MHMSRNKYHVWAETKGHPGELPGRLSPGM